jgi:hypothetical protein
MKKCNTCEIIAHPHKDFYPSYPQKNVCKRCFPVLRDLYSKGLVSKSTGNSHLFMYSDIEINLIQKGILFRELKKHNNQKLKRKILNRLANEQGVLKCMGCNSWHKRKDQPLFMQKHGIRCCHSCHKASSLGWINNNKEKAKKRTVEYMKKRLKEDSFFKFQQSIRVLVNNGIRNKNYTKKSRTHEILGCDFETFKLHIERQFTKGMSWDNRSKWHIDHIYPMSLAQNEEEAIKLNHYTNLRPMWAIENISKGNRIIQHQLKIPI